MRILAFPDVIKYELVYEGLLGISTKGAETRTLSRILTKLERVGTKKVVNGKEILLYTVAESPVIQLEESEFEFLKKKMAEVEWSGIGAKEAGKLLDWLDEKHPSEEEYKEERRLSLAKPG